IFCVMSKAITKEATQVATRLGRPSPDPRLGSVVKLDGGHLHRSLNLIGIGQALASERIAAEEPPPALLQVEPTRAFGNEDVLEAWMVCRQVRVSRLLWLLRLSVIMKISPVGLSASMSLSNSM